MSSSFAHARIVGMEKIPYYVIMITLLVLRLSVEALGNPDETCKCFKDGCSSYTFNVISPRVNWAKSRKLCQETARGDLVSIESDEEWTFLKNTILNLTKATEYFIELEMKRFNGRSTEWQAFIDCFDSAVHSNPKLSKIDKINYLKSLLEGPAAAAIKGLLLTSENCNSTREILEQRNRNKQVIISSHMDNLLKLPVVSSVTDVKWIRKLYDKTEIHIKGLQALGVEVQQHGSRDTQRMVSVNYLFGSPLIPSDFLQRIVTSHFRGMRNLMPAVFGLLKMSFWVERR